MGDERNFDRLRLGSRPLRVPQVRDLSHVGDDDLKALADLDVAFGSGAGMLLTIFCASDDDVRAEIIVRAMATARAARAGSLGRNNP